MSISYKPLWKLLIDKELTKMEFRKIAGISTPTLAKLGKGEYVSLEVIERICNSLNCKIEDVLEIIPEDKNEKR